MGVFNRPVVGLLGFFAGTFVPILLEAADARYLRHDRAFRTLYLKNKEKAREFEMKGDFERARGYEEKAAACQRQLELVQRRMQLWADSEATLKNAKKGAMGDEGAREKSRQLAILGKSEGEGFIRRNAPQTFRDEFAMDTKPNNDR
ncbi:hypothetical protein PMZ80_004713 [Knufia obscura]|uniref:Uncharacterized protein n=2 Tax=Knufia TaxID=430999 RepID=A0AAN8EJA5_9EURO|nr:hypothetical protein PMZ80_004713 [Knufia obscura]KAK5952703.1 hypothetical protein OHC33_006295 [Knufia fluminis]